MNTDCHLYTLPQTESDDNNDTSSDESDLEVVSIVDETDNIDISIKNHFNLDDNEEDNNDEEATDVQQLNLVLNSNDTELNEDLDVLNAHIVSTDQSSLLASSSAVSNSGEESPSCKSKRRQWSTAEKLHAVDMLGKAGVVKSSRLLAHVILGGPVRKYPYTFEADTSENIMGCK
ncbi:unnamed protein product [Didymodactylos carnosus]|uniref:Uncharacterized protein n=1 Tax=Didymodactylos carnosus TaxID=1234261 RepID=A0A815YKE4_9BILA|nr:unnamed protein product [Didymodactylos carnosus]CAF4435717.1 unnamed protein product [Didymodactylos carnosus]